MTASDLAEAVGDIEDLKHHLDLAQKRAQALADRPSHIVTTARTVAEQIGHALTIADRVAWALADAGFGHLVTEAQQTEVNHVGTD